MLMLSGFAKNKIHPGQALCPPSRCPLHRTTSPCTSITTNATKNTGRSHHQCVFQTVNTETKEAEVAHLEKAIKPTIGLVKEHILLLGGTGATGLVFLKHIMKLPETSRPKVTAYVRSRSRLPPEIQTDTLITVIEGALNDAKALGMAMQHVTTVISFLGASLSIYHAITRTTPTPIADSFPEIIDAMHNNSVKRILVLSTPSAFPQPSEVLSWTWWLAAAVMPGMLAPQGKAEMKGIAEKTSAQRHLDWTVFRVPHLNDQDHELQVAAGLIGPEYPGGIELSRKSLVKWVLKEVEERKWIRKAPMLGNC